MKKELEFEIVDNKILNVLDFDWFIDKINMIYIAPSLMDDKKYSIYLATSNEIDKLYYESKKLEDVFKQFCILCTSLSEVNPSFKMHGHRCFNFKNIDKIQYHKKLILNMALGYSMRIIFNNSHFLELDTSKNEIKSYIYELENTKKQDNATI